MPLNSISEAYRILEIHSSSSQSEVKSAYKRLALKTHPDKNMNDPNANVKFQQVTEAFQMLMKVNSDCVADDDDARFPDDIFGDEFFTADFAEAIFRFIFSGNGRTFTPFGTEKPSCDCIDCQFKRLFMQQRTESKPQFSFTSGFSSPRASAAYIRTPSSVPTSSSIPASKSPNFDPHADWLSEGEGEVQPTKLKKFKKTSKKKKAKKNSESRRRVDGDSNCSADEKESGHETSSDEQQSSHSSGSVEKKPIDFNLPSEVNESVKWRAFPVPKKTAYKRQAQSKANKSSSPRKSKTVRSPRTPSMYHTQSSPCTPSSAATTHVGAFSAPSTPKVKPARTKAGPTPIPNNVASDTSSNAVRTTSRPKQPYITPTVPTLEGVQLCRIFLLKHGKCRYGDRCKFSHGIVPGAALAATESDEGLAISPSPVRRSPVGKRAAPITAPTTGALSTQAQTTSVPSIEPSPVPSPVPVTLSPKAPRSTGRVQMTVNPSIGGFGRKAAPREAPQKRTARSNFPASVVSEPNTGGVPHSGQNQRQRGQGKGQTDTTKQYGVFAQSNRFNALIDTQDFPSVGKDSNAKPICVFYNSPGGCVYGMNCRFTHDLR